MSNDTKSDAKRRMAIVVATAVLMMALGAPVFAGSATRSVSRMSAPETVRAQSQNGDNNGNHFGQVKQGKFPAPARTWVHWDPRAGSRLLQGAAIAVEAMTMTSVGVTSLHEDPTPF